jgi:flagellin-like hook-associated protein FlgL
MNNQITNLGSMLSNSVDSVQKSIVDTQNQLAAGKKALNPAENGVVTRLTAQKSGYDSVTKNITDAQSVINVGQTALNSISTILVQMNGLATQSSSVGFASTDRSSLNKTFANLATQVANLAANAAVNGNNLLASSAGLYVTTGINGNAESQTNIAATNMNTVSEIIGNLRIDGGMTQTTSTSGSLSTITFSDTDPASGLIEGDSVKINGLIYTAGPRGASAAEVATALYNFINDGTGSTTDANGTFSTSDGNSLANKAISLSTQYPTQTNSPSGTLILTAATGQQAPVIELNTVFTAVINCQNAITTLNQQIAVVSTAQSSLSAANTGLNAQLSTATAMSSGLETAINSIANIDATALQALLQNLNTQQSVDYYLVSQMNTESSAVLAIFR